MGNNEPMNPTKKELLEYELQRVSVELSDLEPGTDEYINMYGILNRIAKDIAYIEVSEEEVASKKISDMEMKIKNSFERDYKTKQLKKEKICQYGELGVKIGTPILGAALTVGSVVYITAMELKGEIPNKFLSPLIQRSMDAISRIRL